MEEYSIAEQAEIKKITEFLFGMFIENQLSLPFWHDVKLHSNYLGFPPSMPSLLLAPLISAADFLSLEIHRKSAAIAFFSCYCCLYFVVYKCTRMSLIVYQFQCSGQCQNSSYQTIKGLTLQNVFKGMRRYFCVFVTDLDGCGGHSSLQAESDQALIGVKFRTNSHQCLARICVCWRRRSLMLC